MNQAVPLFLASVIVAAVVVLVFLCMVVTRLARASRRRGYDLGKSMANPIIAPQSHREWEAEGTFNPGAVTDEDGVVHLFYRAIGRDGLSRIGHASSRDGIHFRERTEYPVYVPRHGFGMPDSCISEGPHTFDREHNPSGGGWGGAEDPRVVRLGNRVYMTYTAFEGWTNMRIGLTSITMRDLMDSRWNWKRPILISPHGRRDKNWVFFPEKINGKFAILHSVSPKILVAYVNDPEAIPNITSSKDHGGYGTHDPSRKGKWDEVMKGAGAPPIRTDKGWLVLYHAIHEGKYKVGAMLLDLDDPTHVLYRSPQPILSPDSPYENDGKPGVVYATGAVVKDGNLFVYYGGGDKNTCVAETPLMPLLDWLTTYGRVR